MTESRRFMANEEIVTHLRAIGLPRTTNPVDIMMLEAADVVESQAKEIAELKEFQSKAQDIVGRNGVCSNKYTEDDDEDGFYCEDDMCPYCDLCAIVDGWDPR